MPVTFDINKEDRFFIAICKDAGHSFLLLGTYDANGVSHLLCRVGKAVKIDELSCLTGTINIFSALFDQTEAEIADEGLERKSKGKKPISYEAFDINFIQYCQFISNLELLQTENNQFNCYKPVEERGAVVTLERTTKLIYANQNQGKAADNSFANLSIGNTCRHSAIKLIENIFKLPSNSMISSWFFIDLLAPTQLEYGIPSHSIPFYVLPSPPQSYPILSPANRVVAAKLFSRMEKLLTINPDSEHTFSRFNYLKELYQQTTGPQCNQSLDELIGTIQEWKSAHHSEISTLRKTYFWDEYITRKTATVKMIEEIERDLPQFRDHHSI